jgi:cytochrome bd ubiquinol oxidase subunit I
VFYSSLLVIDVMLMLRYIRMGPVEALGRPQPALRTAAMPAE